MNIIFFGSTSDSVIVLNALSEVSTISAVVTQPAKPVGRSGTVTPTPVEIWAKDHRIPVLTFTSDPQKPWLYEHTDDVVNTLSTIKADLIISASYGQKIPLDVITRVRYRGLNIHPSLLPRWRGADPVPWAILADDRQTGVSIVSLSEKFDQGTLIAQKKISIHQTDYPDALRTHLFTLGAQLIKDVLYDYLCGKNKGIAQNTQPATYARKLNRQDGYIPWEVIQSAQNGTLTIEQCASLPLVVDLQKYKEPDKNGCVAFILLMMRALSSWPGVWTTINTTNATNNTNNPISNKRLKILEAHADQGKLVLDTVQLEGKMPVSWKQFQEAYLTPDTLTH